jgi:hypothetical protein
MGVISTFGGSALDRHLYDFESVGDPAEAAAGGDPGGGIEAAGDAPEAPAADQWVGPTQDEWREAQEAIQYFSQLVQPPTLGGQPEQPPQLEFDALADDATDQLRAIVREEFTPYREFVEQQQIREGNARAEDMIADDVAKNGDFVYDQTPKRIGLLAAAYAYETNQQFPGDLRRAAEAAYERAISDAREWEVEVGKAYHEQQLNQLSTLSGAPVGLAAGGGAQQQFTIPPGGSLIDVARRHGQATGT